MRTNEGLPNPLPPTTIWRRYPRRQCKGLIEAIRHDSNIVIEELNVGDPHRQYGAIRYAHGDGNALPKHLSKCINCLSLQY